MRYGLEVRVRINARRRMIIGSCSSGRSLKREKGEGRRKGNIRVVGGLGLGVGYGLGLGSRPVDE